MPQDSMMEQPSVVAREESRDLSAGCPVAAVLERLTRPWTLHILWLLTHKGPMRFGVLKRSVEGISARVLTLRLRELESEGFVRRTVVTGKHPEVTYSPTARTADMHQLMTHLDQLSEKWRTADRAN